MREIMGQTLPFLFFLMWNNMGHCQGQSSLEQLAFFFASRHWLWGTYLEFLSVLILGRRQVATTEIISVLGKGIHPSLPLGFFFFFPLQMQRGRWKPVAQSIWQGLENRLCTKIWKFKEQVIQICLVQDENSCHQTRVTNAVGRRGGNHIPRCPLWVHHTPFLRRVLARHRAGCHTRSSAAAQEWRGYWNQNLLFWYSDWHPEVNFQLLNHDEQCSDSDKNTRLQQSVWTSDGPPFLPSCHGPPGGLCQRRIPSVLSWGLV